MRKEAINQDLPLGRDKRLIKKLYRVDKDENYPDGLEFAYQYLYQIEGKWVQIARIDNQLHEGRSGAHIHVLKRDRVVWENLTFEEAEEKIIEIGEGVIKNILRRSKKWLGSSL